MCHFHVDAVTTFALFWCYNHLTGCSSIRLSAGMAELALVGLLSGLGFIFHTAIGNSFTQKNCMISAPLIEVAIGNPIHRYLNVLLSSGNSQSLSIRAFKILIWELRCWNVLTCPAEVKLWLM